MFSKIKGRCEDDKGNAIIVLGLMLIVSVLVVGGLMLDITKAHQMKSSYINAAKKATQTAVRVQDTQGFLKPEASGEAIRVYENITRPSIINDGYLSNCDEIRNVEIKILFRESDYTSPVEVGTIMSSQVNSSDTAQSIYNKMDKGPKDVRGKYNAIELEIVESTPNIILPGSFKLTGGNTGDLQCQRIGVRVGASQYVGDKDGAFD